MVLNGLFPVISMIFSSFIPTDRIVKNPIPKPQKIFSDKFLKIPLNISFISLSIKSILNINKKFNILSFLKFQTAFFVNKEIMPI